METDELPLPVVDTTSVGTSLLDEAAAAEDADVGDCDGDERNEPGCGCGGGRGGSINVVVVVVVVVVVRGDTASMGSCPLGVEAADVSAANELRPSCIDKAVASTDAARLLTTRGSF